MYKNQRKVKNHAGQTRSRQSGRSNNRQQQNRTNGQRQRQELDTQTRKPIKSKWLQKRRRKKHLKILKYYAVRIGSILVAGLLLWLAIRGIWSSRHRDHAIESTKTASANADTKHISVESPKIDVQLLTVNPYSRPGTKLEKVNGIVIHYVGNAGTTARQNRSYFESLKDTHAESASSHFVVGIDGEIIQCVPTSEISFCSNQRNKDTVAIECCHPKKDGKFTEETYDSLVHLTAFLVCKFELEVDDVIRHYDVTGKQCPLYYVKHEDEWEDFKEDVAEYIDKHAK